MIFFIIYTYNIYVYIITLINYIITLQLHICILLCQQYNSSFLYRQKTFKNLIELY